MLSQINVNNTAKSILIIGKNITPIINITNLWALINNVTFNSRYLTKKFTLELFKNLSGCFSDKDELENEIKIPFPKPNQVYMSRSSGLSRWNYLKELSLILSNSELSIHSIHLQEIVFKTLYVYNRESGKRKYIKTPCCNHTLFQTRAFIKII